MRHKQEGPHSNVERDKNSKSIDPPKKIKKRRSTKKVQTRGNKEMTIMGKPIQYIRYPRCNALVAVHQPGNEKERAPQKPSMPNYPQLVSASPSAGITPNQLHIIKLERMYLELELQKQRNQRQLEEMDRAERRRIPQPVSPNHGSMVASASPSPLQYRHHSLPTPYSSWSPSSLYASNQISSFANPPDTSYSSPNLAGRPNHCPPHGFSRQITPCNSKEIASTPSDSSSLLRSEPENQDEERTRDPR